MSRNIGGSILPSSSPHILQPIACKSGELRVRALPELDTHGLFLTNERGETALAFHPNGYSCHTLAIHIAAGNPDASRKQAQYILDCGGLARNLEHIVNVASA